MTRKHYRMIAEDIRHSITMADSNAATDAISRLARDMAASFKRDNSSFRFDTFYAACGLNEWGNV